MTRALAIIAITGLASLYLLRRKIDAMACDGFQYDSRCAALLKGNV